MNNIVQPEPWSEFVGIWIFYVLTFGLVIHLIIYLFGCLLMAAIFAIRKKISTLGTWIIRFGMFMVILLIVSGLFNALWNCLIWGSLYQTFGADTEDDFTPFAPLSQIEIDAEHGKLLTGTIRHLQLVWLLFAALSWGISFILYRLICMAIAAAKEKGGQP